MLKLKVIAANITNLTDARYFAAYGVDYLLFDLDEVDIKLILEIKEWVSGPGFLVLFGTKSIHMLEEALIRLDPQAFSLKFGVNFNFDHLLPFYPVFSYSTVHDKIEILYDHISYQHIPPKLDNVETWITDQNIKGIVVCGGDEIATGMKRYDDLDVLFDEISI